MAHAMEEVTFTRGCRVVLIPDGYEIPVENGGRGWITQVLGGNYTIQLDTGRLVRLNARDGDAIGKEALIIADANEVDPDVSVEPETVWAALKNCFDPEIPLNVVDLGLIYDVEVAPHGEGGHQINVIMTLTAPGCGMGQVLADDVEAQVRNVPGVRGALIELVFDPPWTPDRMSEAGRLELGMFF
ncbi:MAG: putative Fe-S cluster assembly protein SufT [Rhodobacterales bacterium]|nr:putative Fe-S cluster assembly protein SufT [Rhodobacterales bacterium]